MKTFGVMPLFLVLVLLTACDSYPRDIEGTRDRVVATKQLRVGYGQMPADQRALAERFVARVASSSGAQSNPALPTGSDEALFALLENGDLDLVMAEVASDSPWLSDMAITEPMRRRVAGKRELGLSAVVRNGENRWIMVLEKQLRDMQAGP